MSAKAAAAAIGCENINYTRIQDSLFIDDIRYATLLKQLAERALRSGALDSTEVAKRALAWLELLDAEQTDLDNARRMMVDRILKLRALPEMKAD